jgi:hypothetical protein
LAGRRDRQRSQNVHRTGLDLGVPDGSSSPNCTPLPRVLYNGLIPLSAEDSEKTRVPGFKARPVYSEGAHALWLTMQTAVLISWFRRLGL